MSCNIPYLIPPHAVSLPDIQLGADDRKKFLNTLLVPNVSMQNI